MKNVDELYKKYYNAYKNDYDTNDELTEDKKKEFDYKRFEIIDNRDQERKSTKKEETETKKFNETQKPLWVKINTNYFNLLTQDVDNNLNNNEFKTIVNKKNYDLKNAKKVLVKITTQKISEREAKKLYSDLIPQTLLSLKKTTTNTRGKNKRNNILNILENLESVVSGNYFHYKNKFQSEK